MVVYILKSFLLFIFEKLSAFNYNHISHPKLTVILRHCIVLQLFCIKAPQAHCFLSPRQCGVPSVDFLSCSLILSYIQNQILFLILCL